MTTMTDPKRLVVILPALNEQATVAEVIAAIPRAIPGIDSVHVVVVDDGSTDDTAAVAQQAGAEVVSLGRNRGLGVAFSVGLRTALARGADFIVNIDADGQFDPGDIPALLVPLMDGAADMVTASRFADAALTPDHAGDEKVGQSPLCTAHHAADPSEAA